MADKGLAIAVDPSNNTYITGSTASVNFPVVALAFQQTLTQFDSAATASAFRWCPACHCLQKLLTSLVSWCT